MTCHDCEWTATGDYLVKGRRLPLCSSCARYKVWNVAAHFDDIVNDLEAGLRTAGSFGPFGGGCYPPGEPTR